MALEVCQASKADVERIADIHLAAFDSNPLLHVQFPTPASLDGLKKILCNDMLHTIQDGEESGRVVLVVRDRDDEDKIISFAKWDLPKLAKDAEVHPKVTWPSDCKTEYLDGYHQVAEAMRLRVMADHKCYRMTFVGTDPQHQGRGAATMLTKWGLGRAEKDMIPVYLESTILAASLYQKLGFAIHDDLLLELPGAAEDGSQNVYKELGMLRSWGDSLG